MNIRSTFLRYRSAWRSIVKPLQAKNTRVKETTIKKKNKMKKKKINLLRCVSCATHNERKRKINKWNNNAASRWLCLCHTTSPMTVSFDHEIIINTGKCLNNFIQYLRSQQHTHTLSIDYVILNSNCLHFFSLFILLLPVLWHFFLYSYVASI